MAFNLICKHCGKPFFGERICTKYCSLECARKASRGQKSSQIKRMKRQPSSHPDAAFRKMKASEETEAEKRRERQRQRDEAYAAWARENGVADRVAESGGVRTVIRGQRCVGAHAASFVNHNA